MSEDIPPQIEMALIQSATTILAEKIRARTNYFLNSADIPEKEFKDRLDAIFMRDSVADEMAYLMQGMEEGYRMFLAQRKE
ncbi:hypothetical protein [Komagataeibacter diospyri]|uniref:hypothetical protein n=1 Tax=Komagataeibacter diospyri TaxID=1932662 RepID=UPI001143C8B6|nr:hypothetical protein [Komagataeibacter diospyri]